MTQVQHQYYSNNTYKRTISKVTTAQSSSKHSVLGRDFDGIVKSKSFQTLYPMSPQLYLKAVRKTMILFPQYFQNLNKNSKSKPRCEADCLIDQQVWKFTMSILDRFDFNYETIGLGIGFYLKLLFSKYLVDERPLYLKKFHMSGCIYLAAKSIELERKIPKPTGYQYFCGQNYTSQDYNQFQRFLVTVLDYDLQKSTVFTFLNIYLSMGVFYKNQIFETNKQIEQLENQILQNGLQSLKNCLFLQNESGNPQMEAIKIIKDIRKRYYLTEDSKNFQHFINTNNNYSQQTKRSSCLSFTHSMGNLFNSSQNSSFYTQRVTKQNPQQTLRQTQKVVRLSRKKDNFQKSKTSSTSGSQILKRKPNLDKSYKKKDVFEAFSFAQTKTFKYVALKDQSINNYEQQKLAKQLIKCKSASDIGTLTAMKYQRSNLNMNSEIRNAQDKSEGKSNITPELASKLQEKTDTSLLKSSKSYEYLNKITLQNVTSIKKLSKLSQLNEDRIVEKSRSRSKSKSNTKFNTQFYSNNSSSKKEQKHFNRKNNSSNSSSKLNALNHSYYRNN